jgi:putative oxidoreductase
MAAESSIPLTPSQRLGNWVFANSLGLLILRLALGWVFIYHGSQKLFGAFGGTGMEPFIQGMGQMNMPLLSPAAWAYIAAGGEFFGGLLVLLGLLTRLGALPLIVTMVVAIVKVHGPNGFSAGSGGYEYNLTLMAMAFALVLTGAGLLSLDALIFKRSLWSRGPQPLEQPVKRP